MGRRGGGGEDQELRGEEVLGNAGRLKYSHSIAICINR